MTKQKELADELGGNPIATSDVVTYDKPAFEKIIRLRVKKHTQTAMNYFWASFGFQVIVYALLSYVIVKNWFDPLTVVMSLTGIGLYIPFMYVLMRRFKAMAVTQPGEHSMTSLHAFVARRHELLLRFYSFKKRYELFLIPLISALTVWLIFKMWLPGGVSAHPLGALITYGIILVMCAVAIVRENRKNFDVPLNQLREVLDDFKS